jgi:hypothetical protein
VTAGGEGEGEIWRPRNKLPTLHGIQANTPPSDIAEDKDKLVAFDLGNGRRKRPGDPVSGYNDQSDDTNLRDNINIKAYRASHALAGPATSRKKRKREHTGPVKNLNCPPNTEDAQLPDQSRYVAFDPLERQRLQDQEAAQELKIAQADAMVALNNGVPLPHIPVIKFDDIDLSSLSPALVQEWDAISQQVQQAIDIRTRGIEWDDRGTKRAELRQLILAVRELQKKRKDYAEMVLALGKLAKVLKLFHDLYDNLGACMTSLNGFAETVGSRTQEVPDGKGTENDRGVEDMDIS